MGAADFLENSRACTQMACEMESAASINVYGNKGGGDAGGELDSNVGQLKEGGKKLKFGTHKAKLVAHTAGKTYFAKTISIYFAVKRNADPSGSICLLL